MSLDSADEETCSLSDGDSVYKPEGTEKGGKVDLSDLSESIDSSGGSSNLSEHSKQSAALSQNLLDSVAVERDKEAQPNTNQNNKS